MSKNKYGLITLLILALLAWYLPSTKVDPWNLLNLKKIATVLFALIFIQVFSGMISRILSVRAGALLTGFLGGLVSSTATTAALAKKSKSVNTDEQQGEILVFLSATAAMLIEGGIFVLCSDDSLRNISILFFGPFVATGIMIYFYSRNLNYELTEATEIPFQIMPILKLTLFIIVIIFTSKLLQILFGQNGVMILTFLVSLFEIHGSIIANVQLNENGVFGTEYLSILLIISIIASYVSKLFLVSTLGSTDLRKKSIQSTFYIFLSLLIGWLILKKIS